MTRTGYRNTMLGLMALMLIMSLIVFYKGQSFEEEANNRRNDLSKLQQELDNAARLSAALTELDQMTVNEKKSTQLDILRHLGLAQTDLAFAIESRETQTIGGTNLYIRGVRMEGERSYQDVLDMLDKLYNTHKISMSQIQLTPSPDKNGFVRFTFSGKIYGLDKAEEVAR